MIDKYFGYNYDTDTIIISKSDNYSKIIDLIKYKKLERFSSHNKNITKILNFNDNVKYVNISDCNFDHLYVVILPIKLIEFHCNKNNIDQLNNLPQFLQILDCSNNKINYLDNLPNSIQNLNCSNNKIISLDNLPECITTLLCSSNKLIYLDNLPQGLLYLDCSSNKLINLNNLPQELTHLDCSSNKLINLDNLPQKLTHLYCSLNNINVLNNLPQSLLIINCTKNPLISTPNYPNKFTLVNCSPISTHIKIIDKVNLIGSNLAYDLYYVSKYTGYIIVGIVALPIIIISIPIFKQIKKYNKIKSE